MLEFLYIERGLFYCIDLQHGLVTWFANQELTWPKNTAVFPRTLWRSEVRGLYSQSSFPHSRAMLHKTFGR